MRLSHSHRKLDSIPDPWDTLYRIQLTLQLSDQRLAELMRLTHEQFIQLRTSHVPLSTYSAFALTEELNIGFEAFVTGKINYAAMTRQFAGDQSTLPERYQQGAMSRIRAAENLLGYIERRYGWQHRAITLRRLQMNEAMFTNPEGKISVAFASDVIQHLFKYHRSEDELFEMGQNSVLSYQNSPIGEAIRKEPSVKSAYELVFDQLINRYIEQNFVWAIDSITPHTLRFSGAPNLDATDRKAVSDPLLCHVRAGFASSIPVFLGKAFSKVKKTGCIARGDSRCSYEVDWQHALLDH